MRNPIYDGAVLYIIILYMYMYTIINGIRGADPAEIASRRLCASGRQAAAAAEAPYMPILCTVERRPVVTIVGGGSGDNRHTMNPSRARKRRRSSRGRRVHINNM